MIGNDVIDLALARKESNWKRRGYLQKLFTESEQRLINKADDAEMMLWNLWSRKEAAYKIYNREAGVRAFMPLRLECDFENACDGKVTVGNRQYFTKTLILGDQIHTLAVSKTADFMKIIAVDTTSALIKKDGIPYIDNLQKPASVSHHGRFEKIVTFR